MNDTPKLLMKKLNKQLRQWIYVFLSMNVMAIAIILFLNANLGSDPLTIFEDGMTRVLFISLGQASLLLNCIIICISYFVGRKNMGFATILYALLVGYVIDIWHPLQVLLEPMKEFSYLYRILCLFLAQNFMCFGFALLVPLKLGMSCFDAMIYGLEEKSSIPYKYLRMCLDTSFMIVGFLFGSKLGVGTLFSMCTTGWMIPYYVKLINMVFIKEMKKETL